MSAAALPGSALPGFALPGLSQDTQTVGTVVVTNTLRRPDGVPVVGLSVSATLVAAAPWLSDGREVSATASAVTDDDGVWTLNLFPTSSYVAAGALYRIQEGADLWTITVPAGGGILHDLLVTQ